MSNSRRKEIDQIEQEIEQKKNSQTTNNEIRRYISKLWMFKWRNFESPGPINNSELLCPHRNIQRELQEIYDSRVEVIPDSVYKQLLSRYGGTALNHHNDIPPPICDICLDQNALKLRRKKEKNRIRELDRDRINTNEGEVWFIISEKWLQEWRDFVIEEKNELPPGEISNHKLLNEMGQPLENLHRRTDYRGVTKQVWLYLHSIYKGGPMITRTSIDIYGPPAPVNNSTTSNREEV